MADTLYAAFPDRDSAERAAGALLDHGVRDDDLSLVWNRPEDVESGTEDARLEGYKGGAGVAERTSTTYPGTDVAMGYDTTTRTTYPESVGTGTDMRLSSEYDNRPAQDRSFDADRDIASDDSDLHAKSGISTTTPEDAASGAVKGTAVGLGVGALAALASLFIPGVGLVLGGGALATALGGAALATGAGAITGGAMGYLKDQGVSETHAREYEEAVRGGGALMAITLPSGEVDEARAREIIGKYGATNVNMYGAAM